MNSEELKNKLYHYIGKATDEELINILSFVEEDAAPYMVANKYNHWDDEEFVKEMDRRVEEFESGKVKGVSAEEVHENVLERLRNRKMSNGK